MLRIARVAIGLCVGLAVLSAPQQASAHSDLISTEPAANAVLSVAPTEIVLRFSETVDVTDDAIRLVDSAGDSVELAALEQPRGDTVVARPIDALVDGTFVVAWTAISADSHPIGGAFVFSVGTPSEVAPGVVEKILDDRERTSPADRALGVGRFLSYLGVAVMIGVLAVVRVLAPPLLSARRTGVVVRSACLLGIAGTALMISAQAAVIGSSAVDWGAVTATRSGRWWAVRLVAIAIVTLLLPWRTRLVRPVVAAVATVGGVGLLVVVALGGHAVSGRAIPLGFAATVVHLGAMSLWVGGLVVLTVVVSRGDVRATAARFSRIALVSVSVLAVTGVFNAWRQVAGGQDTVSSGYGRWLLIKLQIMVVVVTIAGLTHLIIHRRSLGRADVDPSRAVPDTTGAGSKRGSTTTRANMKARGARTVVVDERDVDGEVRRNIWFEVVAIVAVVAATAGLAGATPPRVTSAASDTPADATLTIEQGGYVARVDVTPAIAGAVVVDVNVASVDAALPSPDEITATIELVDGDVGPIELALEPVAPGRVTAAANVPLAGQWAIEVTARFGEFDQLIFTGDITIAAP
jgi:copper transport protein